MSRNSGKRKLCVDEVVLDDRQMEKQRNGKRRHAERWWCSMGVHSSYSWILCKGPEVTWLDMTVQTRKAAEQTKWVKKNMNLCAKSYARCKMEERKEAGGMVLFYTSVSLIAKKTLNNQETTTTTKNSSNPTASQVKDGLWFDTSRT